MRRILHMDMDAFFAAVEQKRNPGLIGKPVVIGGAGDPAKRGVVSTASYEARKFGIHSAMPLRTAYKLCPQAVFLPVDYREYSRISQKVKSILKEFSPIMEDVGIDEAFLDISRIDKRSEEIAGEIKCRIKDEVDLTCSIGIAPNKLLAKIASDMKKPDGLTIIAQEDVEIRIWPLPVRRLWGVGPKTEERLKGLGTKTIGDLAALSLDQLVERFGKSHGEYLYRASRGIDDSPLITWWEQKSTSRETTFQQDISDWQLIAKHLVQIIKQVVDDLKTDGYRGRTVTVKIKYADFVINTRAKTLSSPTDSLDIIKKAAFDCLRRFELKNRMIRLIGLRINGLEKAQQDK